MSKIEKFEDLKCWQEARELVLLVFLTCRKESIKHDYALIDQLKRASLSVMNNIAEGFGRYSDKEFVRFLGIAQSSAQEVLSMTYVLLDLKYIDRETVEELQNRTNNAKNLILGLIKYLKNKNVGNTSTL